MAKIGMIGSGSWGTAIARLLSDKGNELVVWSFLDSETEMFRKYHENTERLPGVKLPEDVRFTSSLEEAIQDAELLVLDLSCLKEFACGTACICCSFSGCTKHSP